MHVWSMLPDEGTDSISGRCLQNIIDGFQHEQPDYWLNFGNPWEIERLNVAYPIKFYGHVSVHEEMGRQVFRWNPGESVRPSISEPWHFCIPFLELVFSNTCAASAP